MATEISLAPTTAAMKDLRNMIEFGRSVEHPGLADCVDCAGYAIRDLRERAEPMLRQIALDIAHGGTL